MDVDQEIIAPHQSKLPKPSFQDHREENIVESKEEVKRASVPPMTVKTALNIPKEKEEEMKTQI